MITLKEILSNKLIIRIAGTVLGGVIGYGYYYYFSCSGGSCSITSSLWGTISFFSMLGLYVAWNPRRTKEKKNNRCDK